MSFGVEKITKRGIKVVPIRPGEIFPVKAVSPEDPFLFLPKRGALAKQTGDDELTVVAPRTPTHFFHGEGATMLRAKEGKIIFIPLAEKLSK